MTKRLWKKDSAELVHRDQLVWMEGAKVAQINHFACKPAHDRLSLDMEVAKHFIRAPAANEPDDVTVYLGTQQGHGPSRPQ